MKITNSSFSGHHCSGNGCSVCGIGRGCTDATYIDFGRHSVVSWHLMRFHEALAGHKTVSIAVDEIFSQVEKDAISKSLVEGGASKVWYIDLWKDRTAVVIQWGQFEDPPSVNLVTGELVESSQFVIEVAMKEYGIDPTQETTPGPVESVTYTTGFPDDPVRQIGEK